MKGFFNRIISFTLCICLVLTITFFSPVIVYASDYASSGGGASRGDSSLREKWELVKEKRAQAWDVLKDSWEIMIPYWCAQFGAAVDADFATFLSNYNSFDENLVNSNITVDDDGTITFGRELIDVIKQALVEYQEERYGYKIMPTLRYSSLQTSNMPNAYVFQTIKALTQKYGVIGYRSNSIYTFLYDLSPYNENSAGFYIGNENTSYYRVYLSDYHLWNDLYVDYYRISISSNGFESIKYSWDDIAEVDGVYSGSGVSGVFYIYKDGLYHTNVDQLVTYSGSGVLVFNSKSALMNYSVEKRGVFVSSKFFEDSVDITVSTEELEKSIDNLAGILDDFRESLGDMSGLTEEQLEALLEKFLDDFFNRLGDGGNGGGGGSSGGIDSGLFDTLFDYLDAIIAVLSEGFSYLAEELEAVIIELGLIYEDMEEMTEAEFSEKSESLLSSLMGAFGEIGDLLKIKFPFSIPWDLHTFFTMLSGDEVTVESSSGPVVISAYSNAADQVVIPLSGYAGADQVIVPLTGDEESNAPVFMIPFLINSANYVGLVKIDMAPFDYVSRISRTLFTLVFCHWLMFFTLKLIDLGKELIESD